MNQPQSWEARAEEYSLYGFTDMPSVHERGTVVLTHGEGPYVIDTQGRRRRNMRASPAITRFSGACPTRR